MKQKILKNGNNFINALNKSLDFHDTKNFGLYIVTALVIALIFSIIMRKGLIGFGNSDLDVFSSWYDYLKLHGISSFSTDFSNYNPPYTYFLYLVTLLPIGKIVAIKALLVLFDLLMAFGVYLVVKQLRPKSYLPYIAGIGSLYLPTVVATGVFWGQFDQFYTAFLLFSMYYLLRDNSKLAWLHFGLAIAIKLQAIFFLPLLVLMAFKRINLWHAVYAVGAFIVVTFLPLLAGRSISSILNIYVAQTNLFKGNLTLNAANIYQWVPNTAFDFLNNAGIYLTAGFLVGVFIYVLHHRRFSDRDILILAPLMTFGVPFLLPQMHERYLFTGTVFCFLLAFIIPKTQLIIIVIISQLTTLFSYIPFLFGQSTPIPFSILALANLFALGALISYFVQANDSIKKKSTLPFFKS